MKQVKPKFVLSKEVITEQYNKVKQHCDIVSYSSKTNQEVTKVLEASTDSKFSVHFENELKHVNDFSRVIFLAQAWNKEQIDELYSTGIRWFVVDNETDLDVFLESIENREATLLLRLKLKETTIKTERYFVFGMESEVINKRIKTIQKENLTLGIHFHRKTQNMAEWNLKQELTYIIDEDILQKIKYMNIGGGLPSEYANTNMKVLDGIFKKIDELRNWLKENNIQMLIEPGRFIAAPAGKLVTNITAIHENVIIVNASVYNSDMDAIVVPVKLKIEGEKEQGTSYIVKGATPCSLDLFRYKVYLDTPKVGDKLVFQNAGAYNFTTDFCDLDKLEIEIK